MDLKYVDFKFKIKSSAIKLLTNINNYNLKFIYYYLLNLNLIPDSHKRNYISEVQNLIIHFPQSLAEQQKIAEILSTVDEAIQKTDDLIEKYKKIKT
nr:restriction endonuclease subunit S [Candidatus Vampirococcus lugosii]